MHEAFILSIIGGVSSTGYVASLDREILCLSCLYRGGYHLLTLDGLISQTPIHWTTSAIPVNPKEQHVVSLYINMLVSIRISFCHRLIGIINNYIYTKRFQIGYRITPYIFTIGYPMLHRLDHRSQDPSSYMSPWLRPLRCSHSFSPDTALLSYPWSPLSLSLPHSKAFTFSSYSSRTMNENLIQPSGGGMRGVLFLVSFAW